MKKKIVYRPVESGIPPLAQDESYFCCRYLIATNVGRRIVVSAKDSKAARKWFNDHFNAELVSVSKGQY